MNAPTAPNPKATAKNEKGEQEAPKYTALDAHAAASVQTREEIEEKAARMPKVGLRSTRQRRAVTEILASLNTFASAQDIHKLLEEREYQVGLTTVYRTLQQLSNAGAVDKLYDTNGECLYRSCAREDHHHHLVCTACRQTVEVDGDEVELWAQRLADKYGFKRTGHTAEVFGICSECQEAGRQAIKPEIAKSYRPVEPKPRRKIRRRPAPVPIED